MVAIENCFICQAYLNLGVWPRHETNYLYRLLELKEKY